MSDDLLDEEKFVVPDGYQLMQWSRGFGRTIGPFYEKTEKDGGFRRAFLVEEHHTNGARNCHGGMLMAFADTVWGHSISTRRTHWWVTVRMLTDFVSPARLGDWVEGTSELVSSDDELYTVRGRIWSGDRTIMTGTGIFKSIGPREQPKAR